MSSTLIRLIDLGFGADFRASTDLTEAIVRNLVIGEVVEPTDVEIVRTRDTRTVAASLWAPSFLTHVVAHGADIDGDPSFESDDGATLVKLPELAVILAHEGHPIRTQVFIADCCNSNSAEFRQAVADCLREPIIYIGTRGDIGWSEPTIFMPMLYALLMEHVDAPARVLTSRIERVREAYHRATGRACPYRAQEIQPSGWALEMFRA